MNSYKILSEIDDCWEMIDYLSEKHDNLLVDSLEKGPIIVFTYQNARFILKYNKEYFLRLTLDNSSNQENLDLLYEIGSSIVGSVGKWPIYYDMVTEDKVNPTLEWCLEYSKSANESFIRDVLNSELFDDGTVCENVRTFPKQKLKEYKKN